MVIFFLVNGTACGDIESSIDIPLMTCVPTLIETNNHSVKMLASKQCDGDVDCSYPPDDPCPTLKAGTVQYQNYNISTDGLTSTVSNALQDHCCSSDYFVTFTLLQIPVPNPVDCLQLY